MPRLGGLKFRPCGGPLAGARVPPRQGFFSRETLVLVVLYKDADFSSEHLIVSISCCFFGGGVVEHVFCVVRCSGLVLWLLTRHCAFEHGVVDLILGFICT